MVHDITPVVWGLSLPRGYHPGLASSTPHTPPCGQPGRTAGSTSPLRAHRRDTGMSAKKFAHTHSTAAALQCSSQPRSAQSNCCSPCCCSPCCCCCCGCSRPAGRTPVPRPGSHRRMRSMFRPALASRFHSLSHSWQRRRACGRSPSLVLNGTTSSSVQHLEQHCDGEGGGGAREDDDEQATGITTGLARE